jgi:hypothetical protein
MKAFKDSKAFEAKHSRLPNGNHRITVTKAGEKVDEYEGGTLDHTYILFSNAGYKLEGAGDGQAVTLRGSREGS